MQALLVKNVIKKSLFFKQLLKKLEFTFLLNQ